MPQQPPKGVALLTSIFIVPVSFLLATIIYAVVAASVDADVDPIELSTVYVLLAVALVSLPAGLVFGISRTVPDGWEIHEDKAVPLPNTESREEPFAYLARARMVTIITSALLETPAIIGMIICILSNHNGLGYALIALSFLTQILYLRRVARVLGNAVRMQMYMDQRASDSGE